MVTVEFLLTVLAITIITWIIKPIADLVAFWIVSSQRDRRRDQYMQWSQEKLHSDNWWERRNALIWGLRILKEGPYTDWRGPWEGPGWDDN